MPMAIKSQIFTRHVNIKLRTNTFLRSVTFYSTLLFHESLRHFPTEIAYYYSFSPIIPFGQKHVADLL